MPSCGEPSRWPRCTPVCPTLCLQAGAPERARLLQLVGALLGSRPQQAKRGLLWRPAALLLLLVRWGHQADAGLAEAEGAARVATEVDALPAVHLHELHEELGPESEQLALAALHDHLSDAADLAAPALRRTLAEAVLLALQRMKQRERLTSLLTDALGTCKALLGPSSDKQLPDFCKVGRAARLHAWQAAGREARRCRTVAQEAGKRAQQVWKWHAVLFCAHGSSVSPPCAYRQTAFLRFLIPPDCCHRTASPPLHHPHPTSPHPTPPPSHSHPLPCS